MAVLNHDIVISIAEQRLFLFQDQSLFKTYMIASAKNGVGQQEGSECTPLGKHRISEKIGYKVPMNAIFVGRQWQTEIYSEALAKEQANRDWILTRILWLEGLEEGFNSGFLETEGLSADKQEGTKISCDTKSRYIYIHGCPDSHAMQIPSSHGCIKMRNSDVIELFELVNVGTEVTVQV